MPFWVTHPWLTIGGIVTALVGYSYMFFSERRRVAAVVERPRAIESAAGVAFAERDFWYRISRGALFTALFPGGFSVLMLIGVLFGGRVQTSQGITTDLLELAVLYFGGSVFLGAAIGVGAPFMRGLVRSSIIGIFAVAPLAIACGLSMDGGHWRTEDTVVTGVLSVMFGVALGHGAVTGGRIGMNQK